MKYLYFFLSISILMSCSADDNAESDQSEVDIQAELDALTESVAPEETGWQRYFNLDIPAPMFEVDNLNNEAVAQYSYVEEVELEGGETEVREHYLIALMEQKDEIEGYPVDVAIDLNAYAENAIETLRKGDRTTSLTLLSQSPTIEDVNGTPCIKNEIEAVLEHTSGDVTLYYQLGVYEGQAAFYQVLTWCIGSQKSLFEVDMKKIIDSFSEK